MIKKVLTLMIMSLIFCANFSCRSKRITASNRRDAEAYYNRGVAYARIGQIDQAIKDYSRAIELNPEYAEAYETRGCAYLLQNALLQNQNAYVKQSACDDLYQAGILYLKQYNTTKALECVDSMKVIDPSSPLIPKLMNEIEKQK